MIKLILLEDATALEMPQNVVMICRETDKLFEQAVHEQVTAISSLWEVLA